MTSAKSPKQTKEDLIRENKNLKRQLKGLEKIIEASKLDSSTAAGEDIKRAQVKPDQPYYLDKFQDAEFFREFAEVSPDGILIIDLEGRIVLVNSRTEEIFGYTRDELLGKSVEDLVPERFRLLHKNHRNTYNANPVNRPMGKNLKLLAVRKDDREFPVEISLTPLESKRGLVTAVILRDITEQKQAEEALQFAESRFRTLIENSSDEISIVATDGSLLYESPTKNPTLGYAYGEFIDQDMFQLVHPEDQDLVQSIFTRILDEPNLQIREQFRLRHKDGSWRWVEALGRNLFHEPSVGGIVINYHDITDRKQADLALQNELEFSTGILDSLPGVLYFYDENLKFIRWNKNLENISGYYGSEISKMSPLDFFKGEERELVETHIQGVFENGSDAVEAHLVCKNGNRIPYFFTGKRVMFEGKRCLIGVGVDVTERELAKEQYRSLFEDSPVALWVEDFSEIKRILDQLKQSGVVDVQTYFHDHPEFVSYCEENVKVLDVNSAALKLYHAASKQELLGSLKKALRGLSLEQFQYELIQIANNTLNFEWEEIDHTLTGEEIYVNIRWLVAPGYEENLGRVIVSTTDVTERKRTEQELRQSEEKFASAFEHAPIGKALVAPDGHFLKANYSLYQMLGYTSEELLTKSFQDLTHPDDLTADLAHAADLLAGRITTYQMEKRYFHKDGHTVWTSLSVSLVRESNGTPSFFISQIQDITERKRAEDKIIKQVKYLTALRETDQAIAGSMNVHLVLDVALRHVLTELNVDAAVVLLINPIERTLNYEFGAGLKSPALKYTHLRLGDGFAGKAALTRQVVFIEDLQTNETDFIRSPTFTIEGFITYFGVPLIAKGEVEGVLEIFHRSRLHPDAEWFEFMEALAGQIAIAIDNANLYKGLQRSNVELAIAYDATIAGWSQAMDLRDKETEGHTQRVTSLTVKLAEQIGIPSQDLTHLRRGALLHDIGKLGVPDHILLKPDKLTEEEWEIMRKHPTFAYEMLSPITYLRASLDIPYCHHEKWDGTGYPRGLKETQIPLAARVFSVIDVWDALTSDRPYRAAWTKEQALDYILQQSRKHFDPQVVEAFIKMISSEVQ